MEKRLVLFYQVLYIPLRNAIWGLLANELQNFEDFGLVHRVAAPDFVYHADLHAQMVVFFPPKFQYIDDGVAYLDELIDFKLNLPLRQVRCLWHDIGAGTPKILVHKLY